MLDFTSALYLGWHHPSLALPGWAALTLGRPAALQAPPGAVELAAGLAALQGCAAATLLPSTLHLFWDLCGVLARVGGVLYLDAAAYAVARWGAERGAALGMPVHVFPAADAEALQALLARTLPPRGRPVIVSDGWLPGSDRQPPLARYAALAERHRGYLVLDDTQALGILGPAGGGSLRRWQLGGPHLVVGASLAKGFGVPLAVLAGSRALVRHFEAASETRMHASPPSVAAIQAAARALVLNRQHGDALRERLFGLLARWRAGLVEAGLVASGGGFPVQSLPPVADVGARTLHARLLARQVRTVLHRDRLGGGARVSFLFTATHRRACIDRAVEALVRSLRPASRRDGAELASGEGR